MAGVDLRTTGVGAFPTVCFTAFYRQLLSRPDIHLRDVNDRNWSTAAGTLLGSDGSYRFPLTKSGQGS